MLIKIPDGSLKFKHVQTVIENIHTDIEFEGNKVALKDISAKLGKGSFKGSGTYALRSNEREAYQLDLVADNAEIASDIFYRTYQWQSDSNAAEVHCEIRSRKRTSSWKRSSL